MHIRKDLDANASLIAQANEAVFDRQRNWVLARAEVKRLQDALQRLVNDPTLDSTTVELLTTEPPVLTPIAVDEPAKLTQAFRTRPEIRGALQRIEIAGVDQRVAVNKVLPRLTLILEAQFTGSDGVAMDPLLDSALDEDSLYGAMLNFEYPLQNRVAESRRRRADLELRSQQIAFQDVVEQLALEVKVALRILEGNAAALHLSKRSVAESLKELAFRETQLKLAPRRNALPSVTLDQLLRAQQRLGDSQLAYIMSVVAYNQALMQLRRATGELVEAVY